MTEWNLTETQTGNLALGGHEIEELMEEYGSPLHVVDAARLEANARDFQARPHGSSKGCEVYYSYKSNPIPGVLQKLHAEGIGAEVISEYELWLALKLGVPPEKIVYNGPAKSPASVRESLVRGIGLLNFNSREEIAFTAHLARTLGTRPRVGIRAVVPGGWGGQFGEPIETGAAFQAFSEALHWPDLNVVALHAHRGGEIATAEQLDAFVDGVLAFADTLYARLGLSLEILDFGGSLACPTTSPLDYRQLRLNRAFGSDLLPRSPREVLTISEYTRLLLQRVEDHYHRAGRPVPRIFVEPGRSMTANTQLLACRVTNVKRSAKLPHAILDAGINVAASCQSTYHQILPLGRARSIRRETYRLVGPICTPSDVLYWGWELPELVPGDALAIMDTGAYFVPFATSFSFPQPGVVMVDGDEVVPLRRAERFEDLVGLDMTPLSAVEDADLAAAAKEKDEEKVARPRRLRPAGG